MPLNKLDNFIKNTEGRILYVSPADLDSTDSISNTGNSLARPFKTIQRALLEAARFSYLKGNNNDEVEKTTILLMPGEHVVDNRPGWSIINDGGTPKIIRPDSGTPELVPASPQEDSFYLTLNSNFDITQFQNHLYRFNSIYGGVIVPRGVSIVGLDLRKTKVRPKYVPNPTDSSVPNSAIFRITGACYFWQFSVFDANELETVYTQNDNFTTSNRSIPTFSHHKLTAFEYADGVNEVSNYGITDLDMYYAKLSIAYGTGSGRNITEEFPINPDGFAPQRPEYEIVGAFANDPLKITSIEAGSNGVVTNRVTVTTEKPHGLSAGTPIRISGVTPVDTDTNYNVSVKISEIDLFDDKVFYFNLLYAPVTMTTPGVADGAFVTIETDTVSGASPYVFNISMRSVWGMNGMHADGSKATGFRSMVVAQFTGVSLQKDDRAFVKYNKTSRNYTDNIQITPQYGAELGGKSSSEGTVYHLDPLAIYRTGWEGSHIKVSNDAFIQIVSVFAIGFNKHFVAESGGDASITNSNSNFGQISLSSSGFRKDAFEKDNNAFITHVIPPRAIEEVESEIDWFTIDIDKTKSVANSTRLYLSGFDVEDSVPLNLTQGYRVGAKVGDELFVRINGTEYSANILMSDGNTSSVKEYSVNTPSSNEFTISGGGSHALETGEKVIIISDDGNVPENLSGSTVYYVIDVDPTAIKLASSETDAENGEEITVSGGTNLKILSRVSDKKSGDVGHPVQWDASQSQWYINVSSTGNTIYTAISTETGDTDATYIKRIEDTRSLDEKIYKIRVVVPKELEKSKTPENRFIIQESSSTGYRNNTDYNETSIARDDYDYNKNLRFIKTCSYSSPTATVITELPHNLSTGDNVNIKNVTDSLVNTSSGEFNKGYNGTFTVTVIDDMTFTYNTGGQIPGTFTNSTSTRDTDLPRFERNDLQSNFFVYRNEVIQEYVDGEVDGVYHLYVANSDNAITQEFTDLKYSQNIVDLYPQLDRDNYNDNPLPARSYALSSPIGQVATNDLKKSITRETIDKFVTKLGKGLEISSVTSPTSTTPDITFSRRHGLQGIVFGQLGSSGAGYTPGTHYNVRLLNGSSAGTWNGATATVTVNGTGAVTAATISAPGSGYSAGTLYYSSADIGGNGAATFTVTSAGISAAVGDVVQFTGSGINSDTYHRITSVNSANQITITRTTNDPVITSDHYAFIVGRSVQFTANTGTGVVTANGHGLVAGNRVRITNLSNTSYGDFIVTNRISQNQFVIDGVPIASGYILKHGFSANSGPSDKSAENLATRGVTFYGGETLTLSANVTSTSELLTIGVLDGTMNRFPLGSYIQIDDEIMRVSRSTLQGAGVNQLRVIRGVLATRAEAHTSGSTIKKIEPLSVEFRRPSIIRASGHTFEYLGYGPGNYSTGLPQVQIKSLDENEEYLSQSQERSAGIVVYTGMNNRGDFYIGNQKKSASTGEETTYNTPIPTITGEDPSRLSVVFDEVTVKERIVVEGGDSGQVLSQFDGPVTFNGKTRFTNTNIITNETNSTNTTSGALVVKGGVGIVKNVNIGGNVNIDGTLTVDGNTTIGDSLTDSHDFNGLFDLDGRLDVDNIRIDGNTISAQNTNGDVNINGSGSGHINLNDDVDITGTLDVNGDTTIVGDLDLTGSPSNSGRISANYLIVPNISPIGSIMLWPGQLNTWPTSDWRQCNGAALSRTDYADLFAILGTTYGAGDGSTTFNLPDMRNLFVTGAGNTYNLNATGGSPNAVLPAHTHTLTGGSASGTFLTSASVSTSTEGVDSGGAAVVDGVSLNTQTGNVSYTQPSASTTGIDANGNSSTTQTVTNANLPPYIALYYIIRIK